MHATHRLFLLILAAGLLALPRLYSQTETTQEIADRYEQLLIRSPQGGPSFDRVIDWYSTKGGGLELLQKRWKDAAASDAQNRPSYLILQGLLAERLHSPGEARAFYSEALTLPGDEMQAARLLATLETTEGNFKAAAAAYEKALASSSLADVDRMELMRSLALLYQRSFDEDKALAVWREAIKRFAGNPYVLEEAGEAFLAAGDYAEARKAFAALRDASSRDPFRRVAASLRLARTAELEGKPDEALGIYEACLEETSEGSWLNREVRARIEELFRRKDDLPGLLAFYQKRVAASPQDYQSLAAQAAVLEDLGRGEEAVASLRAATKQAPQNTDLRLTLIRSLNTLGKTQEALSEAEDLCRSSDAPPEALLMLGDLNWSLYLQSKADRDRDAALAAWQRLAPDGSKDLSRLAQLADILAAHEQMDAAIAQWRRIIAISADAADARQRIAEVLIKRNDQAGANAILAELVAGDRAQPQNFITLARIQERMDLTGAARETIRKGLALFPSDYELLNLAWRQAVEAKDTATVTRLFAPLWQSAPNEFFAEDAVKKYASYLASAGVDKDTAKDLAQRLERGPLTPAETITLFQLAITQQDEDLARKALDALKPQSSPVRAARAAFAFASAFGTVDDQVATLAAVAAADPRMAADSLRTAAGLQAEAGQTEAALKTLAQLIERSPADSSLYLQYADIASRAGKIDDAVNRLQDAVRYVEDSNAISIQLATLLDVQGRTADAAKVLQDAFEKEEKDGRRMEIFRRQIELAMRAGTIDDLIAALREKQSREQNGARYGTYLAEIYMLQGDFLSAREELTRSLGKTPNNPAAISRLIDLALRGGDQEEALRLSAKLAEVEPTKQNRAAYLARLFDSGDLAKGRQEFERARPEIVKDPEGWETVLTSMRKAGLDAECDALIADLAAASAPGPQQSATIARLRLMQRDYDAADKAFWQTLESGDLAASLAAVAADVRSSPSPGYPQYWLTLQPFSTLAMEVMNSLQQMFVPYRGSFNPYIQMGNMAAPGAKVTPEQREQVRAIFFLSQLADARHQNDDFFARLEKFLADRDVPLRLRVLVFRCIGDEAAVARLVRQVADDPKTDLATDRAMVMSFGQVDPELKEAVDKINERIGKADPEFDLNWRLTEIQADIAKRGEFSGSSLDAATRTDLRKQIEPLLTHPGLESSPLGKMQVANLASLAGDSEFALRLSQEAMSAGKPSSANTQTAALLDAQLQSLRAGIVARAIVADAPGAQAAFEQLLQAPASAKGGRPMPIFSTYYYGMGQSASPLAQPNGDLVAGDASFPVPLFRSLSPFPAQSPEMDKIRKWFAGHASPSELTPYSIGAFYADWLAGRRAEAVGRLEAIEKKNPSQRTAALLLEAYERMNQPAKALAVIDDAGLESGETPEIRALRRVQLLRAANRIEEAREAAEKLARGRPPFAIRDQLANQLNLLGVPANKYANLSPNQSFRNSNRDRSSQLRQQVSKLVSDKKTDDAERIALLVLQQPLPSREDYMEINSREAMVDMLKSMGRLDRLQGALQDRLAADPGDFDAALRLVEAGMNDDSKNATDRLVDLIMAHPEKAKDGLGYAIMLLQRRSDTSDRIAAILANLIRKDPAAFAASGIQVSELPNFASDAQAGALLADAVAGLSDEDYRRIFVPARLARMNSEPGFISQLAELSVQAGKPDQAIALLERERPEALQNLDSGLLIMLRLAELQLAQGRKDDAKATLQGLFKGTKRSSSPIFFGSQTLAGVILNSMVNRQNGQGGDLILRIARLAEQTGTLDDFLASLDSSPDLPAKDISLSLIVRTLLKKPGIAKEWRQIALSNKPLGGYLTLPMLATILNALADQPDAGKLVAALLGKVSDNQYFMGGDTALASLAETLPVLAKFSSEAAVKNYLATLVAKTMADPNSSRYLAYSQAYPKCINALLEYGYIDEARKLFEFTAAERASRNFGNQPAFLNIEARLSAALGQATAINIVCAAFPAGPDRLRVQWKAAIDVKVDSDYFSYDSSMAGVWDSADLPIPKRLMPKDLELFAGPNPAALERAARQPDAGERGTVEVKVTAPYGLIQARWKLSDGTTKCGPLCAYLLGDNLVAGNGVPQKAPPGAVDPYTTGLPGPTGKEAVRYETSSPSQQLKVDVGSVDLDGSPAIVAFSGWFQSSSGYGGGPMLETQLLQEGGKVDRNSSYGRSSAEGQWRQTFRFWTQNTRLPEVGSVPDSTRKILFAIRLNPTGGYNSQYSFSGAWDGLQIVKLKPGADEKDGRKLLKDYQSAISKKDDAAAVAALLAAVRVNPSEALQYSPSTMVQVFKRAGRVADLFTQICPPSLFLPNPLRDNRPTVQSESLIALLAQEAFANPAVPEARNWIAQVSAAPLGESTQFIFDALALQNEVSRDPSKADPKKILAVLGFDPKSINRERIRSLWYARYSGRSDKPTTTLLDLLNDDEKVAQARALLKTISVPAELMASQEMLEAWLIAPKDPQGALDLWNLAVNLRYGGQNSANVDEDFDRALLLRIAATYPQPEKLVAAVNAWIGKRNSNGDSLQRPLIEFLYAASKSDSSHRDEYAALWADAEFAALKNSSYDPSRDRLRELARRLMETSQWPRLDTLLAIPKASAALRDDSIKREIAQLRAIADFSRGNFDVAWPVSWSRTDAGSTEVHWQWNIKDVVPDQGKFDTAISTGDKALLPEIKGQTAVEILFGELPSTMKPVGRVEGPASSGSLKVELPAPNGFLRAVAVFADRRVPGPLMPVLTGRRIYPPADTALKAFLGSGPDPIAPDKLADSGTAPDGSPSVRLGLPGETQRLEFRGPDFPVVPGKFYVSRAWVRHAGTGSVTVSSEYKPIKTSKAGSLNMLLSDKPEATGPWDYYARAVPSLMQHTFWIPFEEVDSIVPRIWGADPGTEIAAWDLIEVTNWKYADWLIELASLRKKAGDHPDAAAIGRAIELASIEPLTALDYHGDWLGAQLPKAGQGDALVSLYRTAFAAEANPLFSRPKYWRLFNNITAVLNAGDGTPQFRWDLAQVALENTSKANIPQRLGYLSRAIAVAPSPERKAELVKAAREELQAKIADPDGAIDFLKTTVPPIAIKNDRPVNELLDLLVAINDAETTSLFIKLLDGKAGQNIDLATKTFALIGLQAALPGVSPDPKWADQITRGFRATDSSRSPSSYLRWPAALGDLLAAKDLAPDTLLALRQAALKRALKAGDDDNGKTVETIRAASLLIETALAQKNDALAAGTAADLLPVVKGASGKLSEESLRLLLRAANLLPAAQAEPLVAAAEADVRKSPRMTEAYTQYLKSEPSPSPSP